jgi:hypothetical protein
MTNVVPLSGKPKTPDTAVIHRGEVVALDDILFYADQYIHMRHIKIGSDFVEIAGVSDLPPAVQEDEDEDTPVRAASVADTDIEEEEDWTKPLIVKDDNIVVEPDFLIRLGLLDSEGIYKTVEVSSYTNLRTSYTSGLESITYDDYDEAAYPDYVGPCVLVNGDVVDASVINQDDQTLTVVVKLLTGVRVMALPRWQVIYLSMEPTGEDAPDDGDEDNLA